MMKRTGNNHGTMMATAIKLKMTHTTSGTEDEAEAEEEKEKEKALEARAKERPSKEKARAKEKEKDSEKEKDNLTLPILQMPHLLQNHNQLLLTLLFLCQPTGQSCNITNNTPISPLSFFLFLWFVFSRALPA